MMFALPAAKKEKVKSVAGMLLGIAFTSFLTSITEPIEFAFMFLVPAMYFIHVLLTGASLVVTQQWEWNVDSVF